MAKKKTSGSAPAAKAAPETPAAAPATRRRRTAAPRAPEAAAPGSIADSTADDRTASLPEPAGQRVTPADDTMADSVTFTTGTAASPTYDEIAEAAYHRYLSRGATDGRDFDDWIEAERNLKGR